MLKYLACHFQTIYVGNFQSCHPPSLPSLSTFGSSRPSYAPFGWASRDGDVPAKAKKSVLSKSVHWWSDSLRCFFTLASLVEIWVNQLQLTGTKSISSRASELKPRDVASLFLYLTNCVAGDQGRVVKWPCGKKCFSRLNSAFCALHYEFSTWIWFLLDAINLDSRINWREHPCLQILVLHGPTCPCWCSGPFS